MLHLFCSCCDVVIAGGLGLLASKYLKAGSIDWRGRLLARRDQRPWLFWGLVATLVVVAALAGVAAAWLGLEGIRELVH